MSADLISQSISISEALYDFHANRAHPGGQTTTCPVCRQTLHIYTHHVLCENRFCNFRTGTAIDIIAAIDQSYGKALQTVRAAYPKRFNHLSESALYDIEAGLRKRRALLDFFIRHGKPDTEMGSIEMIQARSWLKTQSMDASVQTASILCLSRKQFSELLELSAQYCPEVPLPKYSLRPGSAMLVVPLFAAPSVLAGFFFFQSTSSTRMALHHFEEYKFGFTGLLDRNPRATRLRLHTDAITAIQANTEHARLRPDIFSVGMVYEPRGNYNDWLFNGVTYDPTDVPVKLLRGVADLASKMPVTVSTVQGNLSWSRFIIEHVLTGIIKSGISKETEDNINALQFSSSDFKQLLFELNQMRYLREAQTLEKMRQTRYIISQDGVLFYHAADGYYAIRTDGSRVELTNFTCEFDDNIIFPDTSVYAHTGTMHFRGAKYPLSISSADLASLEDMENAVRMTEFKHAKNSVEGSPTPTIKERHYARRLLGYFREQISNLDRHEGMDGLGWNHRKNGFWTPWGRISAEEWATNVRTPNPNYDFWHCYDLQMQPAPVTIHTDVPIVLADIVSKLIGLLGRSFADFAVKPLAIAFTSEGHNLLRNIFRALGQAEPFSFSVRSSSGIEIKGIRGFPMLVTGASRGQIERAGQTFVALGDIGTPIYGTATDQELNLLLPTLPWIFKECLQWIMKTAGGMLKMFSSVDYGTALAREGASIISQATGLTWPVSSPVHLRLERLLNQIPFHLTKNHLSQHLMDQTVIIYTKGLDVNMEELYLELTTICRTVLPAAESITVDAISMLDLLSNFYGQMPIMKREGIPSMSDFTQAG